MTVTITAFERSPDGGRGLARDMGVRWALHEVGQPYAARLLSFAQMKEPAHTAIQPFQQIPTYEEGDIALFESGAIVLHIARSHPGLLPADSAAEARAVTWIFAALSTMEPPIFDVSLWTIIGRDKPWFAEHLAELNDRARRRLAQLSARLGEAEWLDGGFSAGDLLMVNVLRRAEMGGLLADFPNLAAYVARGEARPAFRRAFADQLAAFNGMATVS